MALFSSDKKATTKKAKAEKPVRARVLMDVKNADGRLANVLKAPWFSEKALIGTENGVYVFAVSPEATKLDVALAVRQAFNVTPVKVHIANLPAKTKALRTRRGTGSRAARHKAYVYLAKGDTLTLV